MDGKAWKITWVIAAVGLLSGFIDWRCATGYALMNQYARLYQREVIPAKEKGLSAAVYTQLSDVEQETNGFVTYDREVVKFDAARVRAINAKLSDAEASPAEPEEKIE